MLDDPLLKPSKDKKIKPYLNISFMQEKVNWYKFDKLHPDRMYEHIKIPAR
jgi:hypothetical protein